MRVERLGQDKIRIFLSFDDLMERGIERDDMWRDIPRVHELFNDMMEQAYEELGFEVEGPVAVEVFALPAQGMVVIVTRGRTGEHSTNDEQENFYELEVILEARDEMVIKFSDLERLVQAAHRTIHMEGVNAGRIYSQNGDYYLVFTNESENKHLGDLIAVLTEYGETSSRTEAVLAEYGTRVFPGNDSIKQVCHYFPL